jgi:very-short-patch-repair endonuclease
MMNRCRDQVGYRRSNHRYRRRRRSNYGRSYGRAPRADELSLAEQLADLIVDALSAGVRATAWLIRRLWFAFIRRDVPGRGEPTIAPSTRATATKRSPRVPAIGWSPQRAPAIERSLYVLDETRGPETAETAPVAMPYRRAPHLLSRGEQAFWKPLYHAVRGKYRLFCKVRLQDVVCAPSQRMDESRWFKKIRSYHVDFVICEPKTTAPLLVIELDDRSHRQSEKRQRADAFKEQVLKAAGLPLLRVNCEQAYDPIELSKRIDRLIATTKATGSER